MIVFRLGIKKASSNSPCNTMLRLFYELGSHWQVIIVFLWTNMNKTNGMNETSKCCEYIGFVLVINYRKLNYLLYFLYSLRLNEIFQIFSSSFNYYCCYLINIHKILITLTCLLTLTYWLVQLVSYVTGAASQWCFPKSSYLFAHGPVH